MTKPAFLIRAFIRALFRAVIIGAGYILAVAYLIGLGATPTATIGATIQTAGLIGLVALVAVFVSEVRK